MSNVHMIEPPQAAPEIDIDEVLAYFRQQYGGGGGEPETPIDTPTHHRHQLMHMDFWFVTAALACQLLIMTSFIPTNAFEPLIVASIAFLFMAVVSNLTREKQGIVVHELRRHITINFSFPRWLGFGLRPVRKPLVEFADFG